MSLRSISGVLLDSAPPQPGRGSLQTKGSRLYDDMSHVQAYDDAEAKLLFAGREYFAEGKAGGMQRHCGHLADVSLWDFDGESGFGIRYEGPLIITAPSELSQRHESLDLVDQPRRLGGLDHLGLRAGHPTPDNRSTNNPVRGSAHHQSGDGSLCEECLFGGDHRAEGSLAENHIYICF